MLKLKSAMKKLPSLAKKSSGVQYLDQNIPTAELTKDNNNIDVVHGKADLRTVYVGKSRRRYSISSNVVDHPLFRELEDKSMFIAGGIEKESIIIVSCEVVMFENLLWMLESDGSVCDKSVHELVEFYTCVN